MINSSFVIGITGNIATGKSVIRRMLSNLGVLGIDADTLANRMLYPGGKAYNQVIEIFGTEIKTDKDQISNKKLGQIVFNDPKALKQLEEVIHPGVIETTIKYAKTAHHPIISIEAIKLIESGLREYCDQIWVSHASFDLQMERLQKTRNLSAEEANSRISAQPLQIEKLSLADVIINTESSYKETWLKTSNALNDTIHLNKLESDLHINNSKDWYAISVNAVPVTQLEEAWLTLTKKNLSDLYEYLGLKMVQVIVKNKEIHAFIIWDNWNSTAILEEVLPVDFIESEPSQVLCAFEEHARINRIEVLMIAKNMIFPEEIQPDQHGFDKEVPAKINYPAWNIAAQKASIDGQTAIWQKILEQPFELT